MNTTVQPGKTSGEPERKKIYEMNSHELDHYRVSEHSQFKDGIWFFVDPTPGAARSTSTLNWGMELLDGSRVTDVRHARRMHWSKILLLTLLVLPSDGRTPAPGSMGSIQNQFKWLLSWMNEAGYHHPHELTTAVIRDYLERLPRFIAEQSSDGEISVSSATRALTTIMQLWDQRLALARMGVASLVSHPFEGRGAQTVAMGVATKAMGWIKPLPDEVAIPLLNKAAWLLGTPADDVLKLLDVVRDLLSGTTIIVKRKNGTADRKAGTGKSARSNRTKEFLDAFEFGLPPGDSQPWHEPLKQTYQQPSGSKKEGMFEVRQLWGAVRDAAAIIVLATSGMRVSELLGIRAGIDEATGLPICVRLEVSATGLFEWFVIRTQLAKTEEGLPREVDWVLGMRPMGSAEIPLAVRALNILNRLHDPWRALAGTDRLILGGVFAERFHSPPRGLVQ